MRIRENPNDVSDVFSDVLSVVSNSNGNDAVHCQGHIQCPPSHTPQKLGRPRGLVGRLPGAGGPLLSSRGGGFWAPPPRLALEPVPIDRRARSVHRVPTSS